VLIFEENNQSQKARSSIWNEL